MNAYLHNGRKYFGSVYVLSGIRGEEEDRGKLTAFCNGSTWGICCGTCLTELYDENGNNIMYPDKLGCSGRIDKEGNITFKN